MFNLLVPKHLSFPYVSGLFGLAFCLTCPVGLTPSDSLMDVGGVMSLACSATALRRSNCFLSVRGESQCSDKK